ncbi:hypothetical protein HanXRQr2_Chr01g0039541 [Helianthus annuus]|uniref:Uncharacterized protein n=1 Tax=Helianthus annuus TaxID=4232 RepID=A0A9K3JYV9_HELAN|nr:hypothetical protein HanXRQr2_Chr01g0039541 [Helianthus annuus]
MLNTNNNLKSTAQGSNRPFGSIRTKPGCVQNHHTPWFLLNLYSLSPS